MSIRDFLYMNKNDRKVIAVLLIVGVIVVGLFHVLGGHDETTPLTEADSLAMEDPRERPNRDYFHDESGENQRYGEKKSVELFAFDPNTASADEFLRLGLKQWQVKNIMKYRSKGGVYRKPADFARLYGLTEAHFRQLEPYIHIGEAHRAASARYDSDEPSQRYEREERAPDTLRFPTKLRRGERLTLDQMDTTLLRKVPGIGSYFARKIIDYERRLGGFVSVEQLMEVEGFPESALDYFTEGSGHVRKLNLNTLTLQQLRAHPYINFHQAKAIVNRRRLHGALKSLDELRLLSEFSPEVIERLRPYVEF